MLPWKGTRDPLRYDRAADPVRESYRISGRTTSAYRIDILQTHRPPAQSGARDIRNHCRTLCTTSYGGLGDQTFELEICATSTVGNAHKGALARSRRYPGRETHRSYIPSPCRAAQVRDALLFSLNALTTYPEQLIRIRPIVTGPSRSTSSRRNGLRPLVSWAAL